MVLLADAHDLPQHLGIEAIALGLGIDLPDIVGDRLLLFFHSLDAFDERPQLILRYALGGHGGHCKPLSFEPPFKRFARPRSSAIRANPHPIRLLLNSAKTGV